MLLIHSISFIRFSGFQIMILKQAPKVLKNGGQCFVVYPLIDESEKLDLEAAKTGFEKLQKIFDEFNLGYINGKMKNAYLMD